LVSAFKKDTLKKSQKQRRPRRSHTHNLDLTAVTAAHIACLYAGLCRGEPEIDQFVYCYLDKADSQDEALKINIFCIIYTKSFCLNTALLIQLHIKREYNIIKRSPKIKNHFRPPTTHKLRRRNKITVFENLVLKYNEWEIC
jgi:hypothetical protein